MRKALFLLLLLLAGCTKDQSVTCDPPYISIGSYCCADINDNHICDREEESPMITVQPIPPETNLTYINDTYINQSHAESITFLKVLEIREDFISRGEHQLSPDSKYIFIRAAMKNTGNETFWYSYKNTRLKDANRVYHEPDIYSAELDLDCYMTEECLNDYMAPEAGADAELVFEVGEEEANFTLLILNSNQDTVGHLDFFVNGTQLGGGS